MCCLADIPVPHLGYHSSRYGRFAIGFHRAAVVRHGFNPVLYSLDVARVVRSFYDGLQSLRFIDAWEVETAADDALAAAESMEPDDDVIPIVAALHEVKSSADTIRQAHSDVEDSLQELLAFVKTFGTKEFGSIYCEREWRSLKEFRFTAADVAMVTVPGQVGTRTYFKELCETMWSKYRLPRSIPVIPWEDLVEH